MNTTSQSIPLDTIMVTTDEISNIFGDKLNLIYLFELNGHFKRLPSSSPKNHFVGLPQRCARRNKKATKNQYGESHTPHPHYPQINVKKLWDETKIDKHFHSYFPDSYITAGQVPDRTYFFTVI